MGFGFRGDNASTDTVDSAAIEDGAIATIDIGDSQVTANKIATGAVVEAKLATGSVTNTKLGADAVTGAKVADDAIDSEHIADGAIDPAHLAAGTALANLATDSIDSTKIAANAIGSSELADNAVDTNAIANLAVTSGKLAAGAALANLATDSIDGTKIAANAIGSSELADNAVDTNAIADAAITAAKFAPGAVGAASLTDGAVTAVKMAAVQAFTANGNILATAGGEVRFSGSTASQTLTLPAAASGLEYLVHNIATVPVTIDGNGSEYIGHASNPNVVLAPGAKVRLIAAGTGSWYPVWDIGEQVAGGFQTATSDSSGQGDKLSMTVVGDGVTPIQLEGYGHAITTGAAGTALHYSIWDGAGGTGNILARELTNVAGATYAEPLNPKNVIAPFTGSKTFYMFLVAAAGTPSAVETSLTTRRWLRATWAPGKYTANP